MLRSGGLVLVGKAGKAAALDRFAVVQDLAAGIADVRNIQKRVPFEAAIDGEVPGIGDWHAIVAGIQTILRTGESAGRRGANGGSQRSDLIEQYALLSRQVIGDDMLRSGQRRSVIIVLASEAIDAPAAAKDCLA